MARKASLADFHLRHFAGIIDYYKDSSETENNRGIVHDYLLQRPGKLYVLATHFHPDHFNREILTWKEQRPDIQYIFSKDILKSHRAKSEDAFFIKKGEAYEDDTIRIDAFGSTDVGSSFLSLQPILPKEFHPTFERMPSVKSKPFLMPILNNLMREI